MNRLPPELRLEIFFYVTASSSASTLSSLACTNRVFHQTFKSHELCLLSSWFDHQDPRYGPLLALLASFPSLFLHPLVSQNLLPLKPPNPAGTTGFFQHAAQIDKAVTATADRIVECIRAENPERGIRVSPAQSIDAWKAIIYFRIASNLCTIQIWDCFEEPKGWTGGYHGEKIERTQQHDDYWSWLNDLAKEKRKLGLWIAENEERKGWLTMYESQDRYRVKEEEETKVRAGLPAFKAYLVNTSPSLYHYSIYSSDLGTS